MRDVRIYLPRINCTSENAEIRRNVDDNNKLFLWIWFLCYFLLPFAFRSGINGRFVGGNLSVNDDRKMLEISINFPHIMPSAHDSE